MFASQQLALCNMLLATWMGGGIRHAVVFDDVVCEPLQPRRSSCGGNRRSYPHVVDVCYSFLSCCLQPGLLLVCAPAIQLNMLFWLLCCATVHWE